MFETAIHNRTQQFRLEKKITETCTVNADVRPLLHFFRLVLCSGIGLGSSGFLDDRDSGRGQFFFLLVIDEIICDISHVDKMEW